MRLLDQCSDLIGWASGSKRRSNLAVSDLMSCVHVCVPVSECVLEWPVIGSVCHVDCIRMNTDPNLTDKHTCSPTESLKTFSSSIIHRLSVSHKAVFQIFLRLQWSFPWRLRPEPLATVANSLNGAAFPSALCFSYSSVRDSRETALSSADWNVKCYSCQKYSFRKSDSAVVVNIWSVFIEVWILSFCETWWGNFSSIRACHVDLTAAWSHTKIWYKSWAMQLNIQRLLQNQTIIQSLMLESLIFGGKENVHTMTRTSQVS